MSTSKDYVEDSKYRKNDSNAGSEALGDEDGKHSDHPSPSKMNSSEEKMGMDIEKKNDGKVLIMKQHSLSKENKDEPNEKQDTNTECRVNLKENKDKTIYSANRVDDGYRDESH